VHLTAIMAGYLKLGQPVRVNHTLDEGEWVRVTEGDEKKFIGLAIIKDGLVAPKRLVVDYHALNNPE
ncbi:tRNA pseudouridine(55) synthase TruB, partial [Proteus mirabilis]